MGVSSLMEYVLTEMEPSGRVLPLFRGDYVDDTVYENPDIVLYNNSSYVAKRTTIGNPPPTDALSDDNWQMVAKGIIDADISTSIVQFNEAKSLENIESSETVETAFGKIKKALAEFIGHYTQKATATIIGHIKLSNSAAITKAGEYALDAIEKNASIEGTLAHLISSQNTVLTNSINQINSNMNTKISGENFSYNWVAAGADYVCTIHRAGLLMIKRGTAAKLCAINPEGVVTIALEYGNESELYFAQDITIEPIPPDNDWHKVMLHNSARSGIYVFRLSI